MSDRKYKQKGYQDTGKPEKKEKRPPEHRPRGDQFGPRTPRMVGTVNRARCSNCGKVLLPGFDPNGKCPSCAIDLHSCKQCMYFDTGARFECMQPIPERIFPKDALNDCTFFAFRRTVEKDTAPSALAPSRATASEASQARPNTARQAFEDLFKK